VPTREERQWQHYRKNKTMRQVRKQIKRNRKTKPPRCRDWMALDAEELDGSVQIERVMPRGERERRQKLMSMALATVEEETVLDSIPPQEDSPPPHGVIVQVSSGLCRVDLDGQEILCGLRGSLSAEDSGFTNVVAVGDRVIVSLNGSDRGVVEQVLPRQSALTRPDPFYQHLQQVVVANADQLLIVASWREPALWFELVDRYLITAARNCLRPIICVNKIDLSREPGDYQAELIPYCELGYQVLYTSAVTGQGLSDLRQALRRQITVLAGMSGVGKSSLLNVLQPGFDIYTQEVSDYSREGRHTTTQVTMLPLDGGGFVVDTPGIREFGLAGLRRVELTAFYPEIARLEAQCRFGDCSHTHEPGCAVKAGLRQGQISQTRYHSFRRILDSLPT